MITKNNKKHKIILSALVLIVLIGVLSVFSIRARAAGTGTINVNSNIANTVITVNPGSYTGTVVVAGAQVTITSVAPVGTYTAACPDKAGYTIDDPAPQALTDGGSIVFNCNYITIAVPNAFLKDLGVTSAETLLFTPSAEKPDKQWSLLKGVGEVSIAGTDMWQKSAAEILYIGSLSIAHITKTSDSHYVIAGNSAQYKIHFDAVDTKNMQYNATVVDVINVSGGQASEVSIDPAGTVITPDSLDQICKDAGITIAGTKIINDTSTPKTVTFNLPAATRGCSFELLVKLNFTAKILSNTVIEDTATITTTDGATASATYDTLAIGPFTQETVGGDVYSKGNLNFGQVPPTQSGAKYVLGADGNVESSSEQGWTLDSYGIRSGSTDDFDPDACSVSGSACKAMNDNIARLKKGATNLVQNNINGTFPSSLLNVPPEGWVYYKNGDLTIGGTTTFQGKGTIIIENGDFHINGDMIYNDTDSMLGIIVKNGNVVIDSSVGSVSAIFYIFSDRIPPNGGQRGSFKVNTNLLGDDIQFVLNGAVIASGYAFFDATVNPPTGAWVRKGAFVLARRYVGDPNALKVAADVAAANGTTIPDNVLNPAELFLYDSRIVVSPPPGFGGKIAGSM